MFKLWCTDLRAPEFAFLPRNHYCNGNRVALSNFISRGRSKSYVKDNFCVRRKKKKKKAEVSTLKCCLLAGNR